MPQEVSTLRELAHHRFTKVPRKPCDEALIKRICEGYPDRDALLI